MRAAVRDPSRRATLAASFAAFLAIGAVQAMYGPAFPAMVDRFGVGLDAVGATVVLHFGGAFATISVSSLLLTRFGYRPVLLAAGSALAAGAAVVALAPAWAWVLAGALLGGLGFGLLNVSFNLLVARVFAPRSAPPLNVLSAVFGLGAMGGPLLVGATGPSLRSPFLVVAVVTFMAVLLTLRVPEPEPTPGTDGERMPWLAAFGFVAMYLLYVASESGIATWETVHLAPLLGAQVAAYATSAFWAAITVGRLVAAPLSARIRPRTLVLGAVALGLVAVLAAHLTPFAAVAYTLAGLAFAPIFPTGLAWIQQVFPRRSEQVTSVVFAVANLGPVVTTGVIGALVAWAGPSVIPTALSVLLASLLAVIIALRRGTRGA